MLLAFYPLECGNNRTFVRRCALSGEQARRGAHGRRGKTTGQRLRRPLERVLDLYLEDALAFFFPKAHLDIDWTRGYEGLETELQQVAPEGERGAQAVDKLIKVFLRDGTDTWVLIHLEVQ